MGKRKDKRRGEPDAKTADAKPSGPVPAPTRSKPLLLATSIAFALWIAGLIVLATLSRPEPAERIQVHNSMVVAVGEATDAGLRIDEVLKGHADLKGRTVRFGGKPAAGVRIHFLRYALPLFGPDGRPLDESSPLDPVVDPGPPTIDDTPLHRTQIRQFVEAEAAAAARVKPQ